MVDMTKDEAMAHLQERADDCSDGDQAYAVMEAPVEILATTMGGAVRVEYPHDADRGHHGMARRVIVLPYEVDGDSHGEVCRATWVNQGDCDCGEGAPQDAGT